MNYEIQYLGKDGELLGNNEFPTLEEARSDVLRTLSKFLPPTYEQRYAKILTSNDGQTLSAYRTMPEGTISQIDPRWVPDLS